MSKRTLKGLRSDLGLTQEEMAKKVGVSTSAYQKYETYQHKIPAEVLFTVAKLCKIDPTEIRIK